MSTKKANVKNRNRLKNDIYRRIAIRKGVASSEKTIKNVIEAFYDDIIEQVYLYGECDIIGFGKWYLGEPIKRDMKIPQPDGTMYTKYIEYQKVKFTPSQRFKDVVNSRSTIKTKYKDNEERVRKRRSVKKDENGKVVKPKTSRKMTREEKAMKPKTMSDAHLRKQREDMLKSLREGEKYS